MNHALRWSLIGLITLVIAAPVAFFLFAMGLMVVEYVIWPTAVLATAVITALAASLASDGLIRDGRRASINRVARWNLIWALLPAVLGVLLPLGGRGGVWLGLVVVYTTAGALILASRNRMEDRESRRIAVTVLWLVGTAIAIGLIIFVASLFGLTGA